MYVNRLLLLLLFFSQYSALSQKKPEGKYRFSIPGWHSRSIYFNKDGSFKTSEWSESMGGDGISSEGFYTMNRDTVILKSTGCFEEHLKNNIETKIWCNPDSSFSFDSVSIVISNRLNFDLNKVNISTNDDEIYLDTFDLKKNETKFFRFALSQLYNSTFDPVNSIRLKLQFKEQHLSLTCVNNYLGILIIETEEYMCEEEKFLFTGGKLISLDESRNTYEKEKK